MTHLGEVRLDGLTEADEALGAFQNLNYLRLNFRVGTIRRFKIQLFAYTQTLSPHQGLPSQSIAAAEQEKLYMAPCRFVSIDAGWYDTGLIQNKQIPRIQVIAYLPEDAVFQGPSQAIQNKQTGGITRLQGSLGDGGFREMVVEIRGLHKEGNEGFSTRY
jgi:hypothetical protein